MGTLVPGNLGSKSQNFFKCILSKDILKSEIKILQEFYFWRFSEKILISYFLRMFQEYQFSTKSFEKKIFLRNLGSMQPISGYCCQG
jgi:hypothetical protein